MAESSENTNSGAGDRPQDPKEQFLFPRSRYYGEFTPQNLAFNANLQEFAQRVEFICALETNGKLSPNEAYDKIKEMWSKLKVSKAELIDAPLPEPPALPGDE